MWGVPCNRTLRGTPVLFWSFLFHMNHLLLLLYFCNCPCANDGPPFLPLALSCPLEQITRVAVQITSRLSSYSGNISFPCAFGWWAYNQQPEESPSAGSFVSQSVHLFSCNSFSWFPLFCRFVVSCIPSWFWGPVVTLEDCLAAFFAADELKGEFASVGSDSQNQEKLHVGIFHKHSGGTLHLESLL